mmetsp:Transcript_4682/g.17918  ORF Transcript_4682/g.17918 Transcript_4682/m.17918 type:complete len:289 (+) Transcript_4682:711-1577(+)
MLLMRSSSRKRVRLASSWSMSIISIPSSTSCNRIGDKEGSNSANAVRSGSSPVSSHSPPSRASSSAVCFPKSSPSKSSSSSSSSAGAAVTSDRARPPSSISSRSNLTLSSLCVSSTIARFLASLTRCKTAPQYSTSLASGPSICSEISLSSSANSDADLPPTISTTSSSMSACKPVASARSDVCPRTRASSISAFFRCSFISSSVSPIKALQNSRLCAFFVSSSRSSSNSFLVSPSSCAVNPFNTVSGFTNASNSTYDSANTFLEIKSIAFARPSFIRMSARTLACRR